MGGLDDITGNLHLSIGSQKHTGNASETTLTGSTIGSSAGDVNLSAGRTLSVVGSDLVSTKDMTLTGADVASRQVWRPASKAASTPPAALPWAG